MQFPSIRPCHLCDVTFWKHEHIRFGDNNPWYKEPFRFLSLQDSRRLEFSENPRVEINEEVYTRLEPRQTTNARVIALGKISQNSPYCISNDKHPSRVIGFKSIPSVIIMLPWFLIAYILFDPMHMISNVFKYCFKSMKRMYKYIYIHILPCF